MADENFEKSQMLAPDAEIVLFELITTTGASVFFKSGPAVSYLGDTYESVPVSLSAEKRSVESVAERPTLTIGGDNLDLAALKPAVYSGFVDGGTVIKHIVQLQDLLGNVNNKTTTVYRVKQITNYNRYKISMILARFSPSGQTTLPHKKYTRPAFPYVQL